MFLKRRPELPILALAALLAAPLAALAKGTELHPSSAVSTELELKAAAGYDSNVFHLNDDRVGEEDGMFTDVDAQLSAETGAGSRWTLGADLDLAARLYQSSVGDGDETQYRLRARGERKPAAFGELKLEWTLSHTVRDSTYVSRSTGQVADIGGVEIGDRFDSGKTELAADLEYRIAPRLYGLLGASVESKDYRKDYASLGLDRLDYLAYGLEPGIAWRRKRQELEVTLPVSLRRYRDRRANDSTGAEIAGSDLEYRYLGVDAQYEYELSRVHRLKAQAGYEERQDNEDGFADSNTTELGLGWVATPRKRTRYSVQLTWSDRQYDRLSGAAQQLGEEAPAREGYALVGDYSGLMPGLEQHDVRLFAEGRLDTYDNDSDEVFSYDRYQMLVGLRKDF